MQSVEDRWAQLATRRESGLIASAAMPSKATIRAGLGSGWDDVVIVRHHLEAERRYTVQFGNEAEKTQCLGAHERFGER